MSANTRTKCHSLPGKVCYLCGASSTYMTKFDNWKESDKSFVSKHCERKLSPSSTICRKDQIEANRYHSVPGYIPKWKRVLQQSNTTNVSNKCTYKNCNVTSNDDRLKRPSFESPEVICNKLGISVVHYNTTVLCSKHHALIHRELTVKAHCTSCSAKPKQGTVFNRHCPNAEPSFM